MKVGDLVRDIDYQDIGVIIYCSDDFCNDEDETIYEVAFPEQTVNMTDTCLELL